MGLRTQAAALTFMHAADVIQPLLVIPFAARMLEATRFGEFVYALSIGAIASTIVDYGFHWTAQRAAAASRNDTAALGYLYANVISTKILLFSAVTAFGLLVSQPLFGMSKTLFICAMLTSAGNVLFPSWLFIGAEQAWRAAVPVIAARIVLLLCFLVLIRSPNDVVLATALQAATPLVAAAVSAPFLSIGFSGFREISARSIASQFRSGWRAFLFAAAERTVVTLPVPLVAHLGGYAAAGQYSVADKFVSASRPFFRIITETFLPRVAYYAKYRPSAGLSLVWNVFYTLIIGASLSLFLFFAAPYVILLLFGPEFAPALSIVRTMAIIPFLINLNTLTANLYMFNFGHERAWSYLMVFGLVVFFTVAWTLSEIGVAGGLAIALAVVSKELTVFLVSAIYFFTFAVKRRLSDGRTIHQPTLDQSTLHASAPTATPGAFHSA